MSQIYKVHQNSFLPKEWIMEKWEEGFYITAVSGSNINHSLVVMSKGARFSQQSYKVGGCMYGWMEKGLSVDNLHCLFFPNNLWDGWFLSSSRFKTPHSLVLAIDEFTQLDQLLLLLS
jgi:hypothetical protein